MSSPIGIAVAATAPTTPQVGDLWSDTSAGALKRCTAIDPIAWATVGGGEQGASEAFPVGSVFIAVVSTSPATLLGYGTWATFAAGRMLVGLDAGQTEFDTVEETGGSKTHTLTIAEMPAHTHVQDAHTHTQASQTATTGGVSSWEHGAIDASSTAAETLPTGSTVAVNQNTGGGGAHNNLPPYVVVYMWKRTA